MRAKYVTCSLKVGLFQTVINEMAFSWMKTTLSTVDGASELLFAFTVSPAEDKTRSVGALVAGMANIVLASNDNLGYVSFCDFHQAKTSSGAIDKHLYI